MSYWSRTITCVLSVVCAAVLITGACSKNSPLSLVPYKPVITFAGIVGGDSLYLPGNRQFPNTCKFYADTVRMYFYSADYSQDTITTGDQLRIDVFSADSEYITSVTHACILHDTTMTRTRPPTILHLPIRSR